VNSSADRQGGAAHRRIGRWVEAESEPSSYSDHGPIRVDWFHLFVEQPNLDRGCLEARIPLLRWSLKDRCHQPIQLRQLDLATRGSYGSKSIPKISDVASDTVEDAPGHERRIGIDTEVRGVGLPSVVRLGFGLTKQLVDVVSRDERASHKRCCPSRIQVLHDHAGPANQGDQASIFDLVIVTPSGEGQWIGPAV
jgi:hypothetical protein